MTLGTLLTLFSSECAAKVSAADGSTEEGGLIGCARFLQQKDLLSSEVHCVVLGSSNKDPANPVLEIFTKPPITFVDIYLPRKEANAHEEAAEN